MGKPCPIDPTKLTWHTTLSSHAYLAPLLLLYRRPTTASRDSERNIQQEPALLHDKTTASCLASIIRKKNTYKTTPGILYICDSVTNCLSIAGSASYLTCRTRDTWYPTLLTSLLLTYRRPTTAPGVLVLLLYFQEEFGVTSR